MKRLDTFGPAYVSIRESRGYFIVCRVAFGAFEYQEVDNEPVYARFSGGKDPQARAEKYATQLRRAILGRIK